jgi:hypothetical protein
MNLIKIINNIDKLSKSFKEIDNNKLNDYINKYKEIFPDFNNYLELIADGLFYNKNNIVYFNVKKGWGKTFLEDLFTNIKLAVYVNELMLFLRPFPIPANEFEDKIILFINDFKGFKNKHKDIVNNITIENKNKDEVEVYIPLKTILADEYRDINIIKQEALNAGINDLIIYDYKDTLILDLLFKKYNNFNINEFVYYLQYYIINYLKNRKEFKTIIKKTFYKIASI